MQTAERDDYRQVTTITDAIARLRWVIEDRAAHEDRRVMVELDDGDDTPEHVRRFISRHLPEIAKAKGWL